MNPFNIKLSEEEEERYNYLKELSLRHYPKLTTDLTAANMAEYLYVYYAKHNCLPDPAEKEPSKEDVDTLLNQPKIIEYKTPADAGDTLVRQPVDEEAPDTPP